MPSSHPLVQRILENRNIEETEAFLNPLYDARHDPFLLKGMSVAVDRILLAIQNKETICVWHDYDCDGIPGGALLFDFFRRIGYPVLTHVAERSEGYGLNIDGITSLKEKGVSLLITVDCGITDVEEVQHANTLGINVIITDHHLPQKKLPEALAVIDAHQSDDTYPYKGLCGTGVAFKLVEGIVKKGNFGLPKGFEKWLLDLVALATVADMVPLTGENRLLVKYGFKVLHKGRREGLRQLFALEGIPLATITEDDLGFSIAPKINASSRMQSPRLAFELLTTESPERAREIAKELRALNQARKLEGLRVAKDVKKRLESTPDSGSVIVMGSRSWRPSLLGIAATSVVESHQKTVCLWGMDGELIKGSCRSDGNVNIVELMQHASGAFLDFGGHEYSGGFSVEPNAIHTLAQTLEASLKIITEQKKGASVLGKVAKEPECFLTLAEANDSAYDSLRLLAPFGQENTKPYFRFTNARVDKVDSFGKGSEHARLTLSDDSGRSAEAISFFIQRTDFKDVIQMLSEGDRITLDASIERSYFRGRKQLRLRIESLSLVEVT
ncbi:single-stranded-DNA-specific exonuclease RecJ [Patescibacteria group bacterium]|nr:MAG: single-stranded-DNA-specific exonuclease RecJ [Patescibacteria group bacterium]